VLRAIRRDDAHEAALARVDQALEVAGPDYLADAVKAVTAARNDLERRIEELPLRDADLAEARAARITDSLVRTVAAAPLLGEPAAPPRPWPTLPSARQTRPPGPPWEARIAAAAGRELVAFEDLDHATAEKAAA